MILVIKEVAFWTAKMATSFKEYLKHLLLQPCMDPSLIKNKNIRLFFKHKTPRTSLRIHLLNLKITQSACMTCSASFP
jgi:hypothetical protein